MVEQEGFAFPVAIEYEGLPDFCTHCHSIGHTINFCRRLHPRREETMQPNDYAKQLTNNGKQHVHSQKSNRTWKPKDNPDGIGSSKAFTSVDIDQQAVSIPEIVLVDNDITVPTQQHATSTEPHDLAVTHNTNGTDKAAEITDDVQIFSDESASSASTRED